jgi:hypothetical protein
MWRRRPDATRPKKRVSRPVLEGLEDRMLLYSANGGTWTYGARITFSFVPDGTNIGGKPSALFSTLNAVAPTATWQQQFLKAATLWSSYAHINLALVPDDGSPLGDDGYQQGDGRFGDIRISAIPLASGTLALALLPPPINGGTSAGDIVLNSTMNWSANYLSGSGIDLETVALHEIGHALGLDHSALMGTIMNAYYSGPQQYLANDDIAGIQSIYGPAPTNPATNRSFDTAWNITPYTNYLGQTAVASQYLGGSGQDGFYYLVVAPQNTNGTMTVSMQSTNLSMVSPKVNVYYGNQQVIGTTSLPNSMGATATFTVYNVVPGWAYYIRTQAASGMGSVGAYGLLINFNTSYQGPIPPPNTQVPSQASQGGGSAADTLPDSTVPGPRRPPSASAAAQVLGGLIDPQSLDQAIQQINLGGKIAWADAYTLDQYHDARPPVGGPANPVTSSTVATTAQGLVFLAPLTDPATQAVDDALTSWQDAGQAGGRATATSQKSRRAG